MNQTWDTILTVVLFVALLPAVVFAGFLGLHLMMLGDAGAGRRTAVAVGVGVVGVPLSALGVYVAAVVLAWRADGHTFYYPLVALVAGAALVLGLTGLADRIARGV
ncbi:MAG: hypothetical protein QM662_12480 [Gordonia sp. (in: high G+C Gram-positive bacteria)]